MPALYSGLSSEYCADFFSMFVWLRFLTHVISCAPTTMYRAFWQQDMEAVGHFFRNPFAGFPFLCRPLLREPCPVEVYSPV